MNHVLIRVLRQIPGYSEGRVLRVPADSEGTPLELFWRRRLKDAALDQCCEIVAPEPEKVTIKRRRRKEPSE